MKRARLLAKRARRAARKRARRIPVLRMPPPMELARALARTLTFGEHALTREQVALARARQTPWRQYARLQETT